MNGPLRAAAAQLARPCTHCTCTRRLVDALDVDPDCPGLTADGCRTLTHLCARLVLTDAGVHVPPGSRRWLARSVLAMVDDLESGVDVPVVPWRAAA